MKRVLFNDHGETVLLAAVPDNRPIFAKREGIIVGMVMMEDEGWILRFPNNGGATGHHDTKYKCLVSAEKYGYTFYTE